jgi:uncharacterized protein YndB with AHSA1/START domain/DNA-binding transcriptional ArsR family regulator
MSHLVIEPHAPHVVADGDDEVFKALADPSRRLLLDSLFERDGQTLGELTARLPDMTRFGVMKHLRQLEAAGLVTTHKVGREKLHYLNPVPIRLIHDRWIDKYAERWVGALADLKRVLEGPPVGRPGHVFQVSIRARPERVWQALTDPSLTQQYLFRTAVASSWVPGEPIAYRDPDGRVVIEGRLLEVEPPRRLVTTWAVRARPRLAQDRPARVTWEIVAAGEGSRLTLSHVVFNPAAAGCRPRSTAGRWCSVA